MLRQAGQLVQAVGYIAMLALHDPAPVQSDAQFVRVRNSGFRRQPGPVALQALRSLQGKRGLFEGQQHGIAGLLLKPWDERSGADNKAQAIVGRAMGAFSQYKDGLIFALVPPAVQELGNATGFDAQLLAMNREPDAKKLRSLCPGPGLVLCRPRLSVGSYAPACQMLCI